MKIKIHRDEIAEKELIDIKRQKAKAYHKEIIA